MTAENLKNWLKEQMKLGDGQIAVGAIDGNQDRYIGVYDGKASGTQRICVGGRKNTKYQDRAYVVLIHWTTSPSPPAPKLWRCTICAWPVRHRHGMGCGSYPPTLESSRNGRAARDGSVSMLSGSIFDMKGMKKMANTGVFPVFDNVFKVGKAGRSSEAADHGDGRGNGKLFCVH